MVDVGAAVESKLRFAHKVGSKIPPEPRTLALAIAIS